ncbi:MAG: type II secretion system F family protein [Anaerolineales bacterium]|nr:type II secretion system F family protein [Anaerolineales bacterium]
MSPALISIIFVAVAVILLVFAFLGSGDTSVEERLSRYTEFTVPVEENEPTKEDKQRSSPVADYLEKNFSHSDWFEGISKDIARADLKLRPTEYIALIVIATIGMGAIAFLLFKSILLAPVGAVIGFFLPGFYIKQKQSGRLHQFEAQMADMLNLSVNSLRAGYSVIQALESVAKEMPSPMSVEIRRVVQEVQIGLTLDVALENLLRRMNSPDLKLIITAINIQREVGGNLAEILDTISHTIRERVRIKGEIRVLTAQQSITGYLIGFLPFGLGGFLYLYNPSYIGKFFAPESRACGIPMVICGGLLIVGGFVAVRKIVSIEI